MEFFPLIKVSDAVLIKARKLKMSKLKSQQHPVFPSGLPSKYCLGPMLLNFSDRTRTGVFNMVWPLTRKMGKKYLS